MRTSASKLYMRLAVLVAVAGLVLPVVLSRSSAAQSADDPTVVNETAEVEHARRNRRWASRSRTCSRSSKPAA